MAKTLQGYLINAHDHELAFLKNHLSFAFRLKVR